MHIGKQMYRSIRQALQRRAPRVAFNRTWSQIHRELAIGRRDGHQLHLTAEDRERLRQAVYQATNLDPLHEEPDGDRLEMALRSSDEKLASQPVFGGLIHLFRSQRPIPLRGGEAVTPPGSHLVTRPEQLATAGLDAVVVVENGAAFLNWAQLRAAPELRHTLALYRGHDEGARQVLELLQRLRGHTRIVAAVDFDPAGFRIALSLGADALLVPEHYPRILQEPFPNKPEAFEKQDTKMGDAQLPAGWRPAWDWLHRHRIAVTQEALLAREWHMVALPASG